MQKSALTVISQRALNSPVATTENESVIGFFRVPLIIRRLIQPRFFFGMLGVVFRAQRLRMGRDRIVAALLFAGEFWTIHEAPRRESEKIGL